MPSYTKPKKPRKGTIRDLVFSQLKQRRKDDTIIAEVKKRFPEAKFNENPRPHLAVYKTNFKTERNAA